MPKFKLEEFLLPWERDMDGKRLEEPGEIDVEQLRKYVYGLLTDKEQAQEARETALTERDAKDLELKELRQKNENDEDRRAREEKEREARYEKLEKEANERRKIEALEEAFPDATAARIKRLAKRVTSDDPKDWVTDAQELVEDGFRISDKKVDEVVVDDDDLSVKPVRRSNGERVVTVDSSKPKSVAEEIDAAGIGRSGW